MKKNLFFQLLIVAVLSAGLTVCCGFLFLFTDGNFLFQIEVALLFTLILLALCFGIAWFGAGKFCGFIDKLNAELEKNEESIDFSFLRQTPYPPLLRLQKNVSRLCTRVRASRLKPESTQNQFDFILNNMHEGFLIADFEKRIIYLNQKGASVLGISPNSFRKKINDVIHDHDILEAVDKAVSKNKITTFDLSLVDGSIYLLTAQIIREDNVRRRGRIVLAMTDVTAERSALKQRQDFFSNASHELKTPITSIRGFAELLETGIITDHEKARDSVKIIHREAERMTRIVDDLLFISKLENDGEKGQLVDINIRKLIREIGESLSPVLQQRNITLEVSGGDFSIRAVSGHMHNLFGNLIQNAVKYNVDNGSVWVRVETDGKHLYLIVKDTGIGIPAELRLRVFERFFRVDKGRSRSVGGTGLGLAIVKHIVSLYDGTIQLDSTLGEGTTISAKIRIGS